MKGSDDYMAVKLMAGNSKGGIGKTLISNLFGYHLAERGNKVLIVDFDPQGNTTRLFREKYKVEIKKTIYQAVTKDDLSDLICTVEGENISLIPTSADLSLLTKGKHNNINVLKNIISQIESDFDYIIIDTPPTMEDFYLQNVFNVVNYFVIIVENSEQSFQNVYKYHELANDIYENLNPDLEYLGILMNKRDDSDEIFSRLKEKYGLNDEEYFKHAIPKNARLAKYSEDGVYNYMNKKSNIIKYDQWDYKVMRIMNPIIDELLERINEAKSDSLEKVNNV